MQKSTQNLISSNEDAKISDAKNSMVFRIVKTILIFVAFIVMVRNRVKIIETKIKNFTCIYRVHIQK